MCWVDAYWEAPLLSDGNSKAMMTMMGITMKVITIMMTAIASSLASRSQRKEVKSERGRGIIIRSPSVVLKIWWSVEWSVDVSSADGLRWQLRPPSLPSIQLLPSKLPSQLVIIVIISYAARTQKLRLLRHPQVTVWRTWPTWLNSLL